MERKKKMTFNEECRFLDLTKMESDVIKHRTTKGKEKIRKTKHFLLGLFYLVYYSLDCM